MDTVETPSVQKLDKIIDGMGHLAVKLLTATYYCEAQLPLLFNANGNTLGALRNRNLASGFRVTTLGIMVRKRLIELEYKIANLDRIKDVEASKVLDRLLLGTRIMAAAEHESKPVQGGWDHDAKLCEAVMRSYITQP